MAITFPVSLDVLQNPAPTDKLNNNVAALQHANQHSDVNDAVEALQAKVGIDGSVVVSSLDYKIAQNTTALANTQPLDTQLTALAALSPVAGQLPYFTSASAASLADISAYGRTLIDDADATTARATLGVVIGTNVQAFDSELAAIAGLTSAADRLPYFTGAGTAALATFTTAGRNLIDDADTLTQRATLGLTIGTDVQAFDSELAAIAGLTSAADRLPYFTGSGTATLATFTTAGRNLIDDADTTTQRATLGLVIGTDVQAFDAELAAIAGLTSAADRLPYFTGSGTAALATFSSFARTYLDDADAATTRATLGATGIYTNASIALTGGSTTNVVHNLNSAFPISAFYDTTTNELITGLGVKYVDVNTISVTPGSSLTVKAVVHA